MKTAIIFACIAVTLVSGEAHLPYFARPPFYGLPGCPEAVCTGCAEEGASDIKAILAIDCHAGLEDCHAAFKPQACHEALKGCVKCHIDPTDEACTKDCLIGPGPCIRDAKITLGKCIADQNVAVGKCIHDKKVSLAKAEECLACAPLCPKE